MRLDKLLAHCGFGTRKEVKDLIKKGYVIVNNNIVKKDKTQVDPEHDQIFVDDDPIIYEKYVYYMLNKPAGYVSATEDHTYPTVVELIDDYYRQDLFPVGRLDIDTEGLLLMTNDGLLAHQLLSPKRHCPKIYYARIDGVVNENDVQTFLNGVVIEDYCCLPAYLKILSVHNTQSEVEIKIFEGKFHQIKKMFLAVGKKVIYLKRIQMKDLILDPHLKLGEYRRLTDEELYRLKEKTMLK